MVVFVELAKVNAKIYVYYFLKVNQLIENIYAYKFYFWHFQYFLKVNQLLENIYTYKFIFGTSNT